MNIDPKPDFLKRVEVLHCSPNLDQNRDNSPVTVVTLSCAGEIEQPALMSLADSRKLMLGLLQSLVEHGDHHAKAAAEAYLEAGTASQGSSQIRNRANDSIQADAPPHRLRPIGVQMMVRLQDHRPLLRLEILGGYSTSQTRFIFLYQDTSSRKVAEGLAEVEGCTIRLGVRGKDFLKPDHWSQFHRARCGCLFTLGMCQGMRLSKSKIKSILDGKILMCVRRRQRLA